MDKDNEQNNLSLSIDYASVIQEDETVCLVEMDILHLGLNRNNSIFTKEGVESSLETIYNKPIITRFNCEIKSLATDYDTHAKDDKEAEQICCVGVIPMAEYSNPRWIVTDDGFERLRVNALIWKFYAENVVDILQKKDGESKVSIEIAPTETHKDDAGHLIIDNFLFMSCFMLGDNIPEGMKGSKLVVTKFSLEEMVAKSGEYLSKFSKNGDSEDIFDKIKKRKGGNKVKLGHRELESQIWAILSGRMFVRDKETYNKYYIKDIYDGHIVVEDNETHQDVKFKYNVDEEGVVHIDFTSEKVIDKDRVYRVFAKEDIGTESALKVDKKRISDDAWGGVDKAELRERVVKAENFKEIADDVFLDLREGWEDGEVSKLKYPVMQLVGDTLIYNRGALASAKGYAEKNNETEILAKLKKIYESLELDFDAEDLTKVLFECGKEDYETEDCCEGHEDCNDNEDDKTEGDAQNEETKDFEEEPKTENENSENAEGATIENIETMSADDNVDAAAQTEMLNKEADQNADLADEGNKSIEELKEKDLVIAELNRKIEEYEVELDTLRKFKAETEERQKLFRIEQIFAEVSDDISQDKKDEFRADAQNYSLNDIEVWANAVKAEAFKSAKTKSSKATFQKMDIWGAHNETSNSDSLWNCTRK